MFEATFLPTPGLTELIGIVLGTTPNKPRASGLAFELMAVKPT